MSPVSYRPDIDGLRALAVLGVILFHFGLGRATGGFVGVDVFFVISGYLITGIIVGEIREGRFSYARFYERRVRRLFPALFAVLLATMGVGLWLLLPSDLVRLGRHVTATVFFVSNVDFWRETGYFDNSSEFNPLLHTWSLAVEEQFYIFLPPALLVLGRLGAGKQKAILGACLCASLAACILLQPSIPSAVFFWAPFRAWEFLFGALIVLGTFPELKRRSLREAAGMFGLALLMLSFFRIRAGGSYPGWHALLPVVGTALLLQSGKDGPTFVRRALSVRPLVLIGLASYSLYLWHWPMLFFLKYRGGMQPIGLQVWPLLLAVFALSYASYRWIELPFRSRGRYPAAGGRALVAAGTAMLGVVLLAACTTLDGGMKSIHPAQANRLDALRDPPIPYRDCHWREPPGESRPCILGAAGTRPQVLLWGDSTAMAWAPAYDRVLRKQGVTAYLAWSSGCPPLQGVANPAFRKCAQFNTAVLQWLRENPVDRVVMVAIWPSYSQSDAPYTIVDDRGNVGNVKVFPGALERTVHLLDSLGAEVTIVGPTPGAPEDVVFRSAIAANRGLALPAGIKVEDHRRASTLFWETVRPLRRAGEVSVIDPAPWFCGKQTCSYRDQAGALLYRDVGHLSLRGAGFVADHLLDQQESAAPSSVGVDASRRKEKQ